MVFVISDLVSRLVMTEGNSIAFGYIFVLSQFQQLIQVIIRILKCKLEINQLILT